MVGNYDLKPEDQLLLNCSVTQISEENIKRIKQLTNQDLDWNYLINMAYKHRLNPLLYWHLNKISPETIPHNLKLELKEQFHRNVRKNLMMFKELLEVLNILQKHGIVPIPYKGPVLTILIYKNIGFRIFGDLDFYVPLEDVPRTKEILIEEGYEPWMELTPNQEMAFHKFQREYHFTNRSTSITMEIKWKFLSSIFAIVNEPFLDENQFFREVEVDQFKMKTVSPEYLILILSIHNASHSFSSFYRFCDIYELIKFEDNINWQRLFEIASDLGVQNIFMVNLYVLRELFGVQFSKDILELINASDKIVENISEYIIRRLFTLKPICEWERFTLNLKLREKNKDKFKTLLNIVFLPTPGVIEIVSLPLSFVTLYYIIRVFQLLKNISQLIMKQLIEFIF